MLNERNEQHSDPVALTGALEALFPRQVIDQNALTVDEVAVRVGLQRSQAARRMMDAVNGGTWEQVWKRAESGRLVRAYRPYVRQDTP
jgi:hypothetical protein